MINTDKICFKMKIESHPIYQNKYLKPFIDAYFAYPKKHKYKLFQGYIPNNQRIIDNFLIELSIKNSNIHWKYGQVNPEKILTPSGTRFRKNNNIFQREYGFFMTYFIGYNIRNNNIFTPIFIYNHDKSFKNESLTFSGFYQNFNFKELFTPYNVSLWPVTELKDFEIPIEWNYETKKREKNPFIIMSETTAKALKELE